MFSGDVVDHVGELNSFLEQSRRYLEISSTPSPLALRPWPLAPPAPPSPSRKQSVT